MAWCFISHSKGEASPRIKTMLLGWVMFRPIFIGPPTKDRKVNQHQNSESIFLVTTIFSNSPIYIQLSNSPKTSSFKHLNPPWTNATFPNVWGSKCQVRCEGHRVGTSRGWFEATAWTRGRHIILWSWLSLVVQWTDWGASEKSGKPSGKRLGDVFFPISWQPQVYSP